MLHNIHAVRDARQAQCCLNGQCQRCREFRYLASRALNAFGCVLVRPDANANDERVDNDDNDPDQPTYREDYEAFDMICQLREEKSALVKEVEELKKHERENKTLKDELEASKQRVKEIPPLKRQVTMSKKQVEELRSQLTTLSNAPAAVPESVFVLFYRAQADVDDVKDVTNAEIKGVFPTLAQATKAFHHCCRILFPSWRTLVKKDFGVSNARPHQSWPEDNEALKWTSGAGELHTVANLGESKTGFLWIEKQPVHGQAEVDALSAERKMMRKQAKNEARQGRHAVLSIEQPLATPEHPSRPPSAGMLTPLEEEPLEPELVSEVAMDSNDNTLITPSFPPQPDRMAFVPLAGTAADSDDSPVVTKCFIRCITLSREPSSKHESSPESDSQRAIYRCPPYETPSKSAAGSHGPDASGSVKLPAANDYCAPIAPMSVKTAAASAQSPPRRKRRFFHDD